MIEVEIGVQSVSKRKLSLLLFLTARHPSVCQHLPATALMPVVINSCSCLSPTRENMVSLQGTVGEKGLLLPTVFLSSLSRQSVC